MAFADGLERADGGIGAEAFGFAMTKRFTWPAACRRNGLKNISPDSGTQRRQRRYRQWR
jgi:hypothetical protein